MKKLLTKLKDIASKVATVAVIGWFAFALSFDAMAVIMFAFFPETWSEMVYHMNQFLGF